MKHSLIFFILIFIHLFLYAQIPKATDYGVRHMMFSFESLPVDILIQSKSGEEKHKKPLLFFCQGSLPQPLLKYDEQGLYGIFPFNPEVPFEKLPLNDYWQTCCSADLFNQSTGLTILLRRQFGSISERLRYKKFTRLLCAKKYSSDSISE